MLEQFFPHGMHPLAGCAHAAILEDLAVRLHEAGHKRKLAQGYLLAAGHFCRWLDRERIPLRSVTEATTVRFAIAHLPACRCCRPKGSRCYVRAALGHFFAVLRQRGVVDDPCAVAPSAVSDLMDQFDAYLVRVCGAAPSTRRLYRCYARGLLDARYGSGPVDMSRLRPEDLIRYVSDRTKDRKPETAKVIRTALRSLLRFAQLRGLCDVCLAAAVPKVAQWKRSGLPKSLSDDQLAALLASFEVSSCIGQRDRAMVLCMSEMGLRAGEVAGLRLDDIDWRAGILHLNRGKERRGSLLPLPAQVGRAIARYLRYGRPETRHRNVFARVRLPFVRPLNSGAVSTRVRAAFVRAGLPAAGAHVLRHTAATRMLRAGASLKQVADVLRHRSLDTVMIYTKVDLKALAQVATAWPEVCS